VTIVSIMVIAVNDVPQALDDAFATDEDAALTVAAPGVLGNDTDADSTTLTAALATAPSHGQVVVNADGGFVYTPNANFNGLDTFTYTVSDGEANAGPVTVTITVRPVDDPFSAAPDALVTNEDTVLVLPAPGLKANDADPDGDAAPVVTLSPRHGTLTVNTDGSLRYAPAANYFGSDSFTYVLSDGASESNHVDVTITIVSVNDPPVAQGNQYATDEDDSLAVPAFGVLLNDDDVDSGVLSAVLASGPSNGTLTLHNDGALNYVPNPDFVGTDSFTYRASDGTDASAPATVVITVRPVNDAPVAYGESFTADEEVPLTVAAPGLLANDTDIDSTALTAVKVGNPTHGTVVVNADGSFVYTPALNYDGSDSFTYRTRDASGALSNIVTVSLTVNEMPDPPVAVARTFTVNEDSSRSLALTGTDPDGDALTFELVTLPANGTVIGVVPNLIYRPAANFNGTDTFTFVVSDGTFTSAPATVTMTVAALNDAPVAQNAAYSTPAGTALNGQLGATDIDSTALTYAVTTAPTKGTVTVDAATGAFVYTPTAGMTGADSFRFRANDGKANSGIARIDIVIQP
jgi:VCBS repeat-containing protein